VRGADGGRLVEVQDAGLGFDAEQAKLLFRTYSRVHRAVAPGIPGSGLGLYLVQEVAHAHGGWAKAASPGPGLGSTFSVWLPLKPPAAPELAAFRA
jgi:signal transduction histidine kinase